MKQEIINRVNEIVNNGKHIDWAIEQVVKSATADEMIAYGSEVENPKIGKWANDTENRWLSERKMVDSVRWEMIYKNDPRWNRQ